MKQYVMKIHTSNGATVSTPLRFAVKTRCNRLKRELSLNKDSGFRRWGSKNEKINYCSYFSFMFF